MKTIYLLLIAVCITTAISAQDEKPGSINKIVFDMEKGVLESRLPFYQTFILQVKTDGKMQLASAELHEVKVSAKSINYTTGVQEYIGKNISSSEKMLSLHQSSEKLYEIFVPPLEPLKDYDIDLIVNLSDKECAKITEIIYAEVRAAGTGITGYSKFAKEKNHSFYSGHPPHFEENYNEFKNNVVDSVIAKITPTLKETIQTDNATQLKICKLPDLRSIFSSIPANRKVDVSSLSLLSNGIETTGLIANNYRTGIVNLQSLNKVEESDLIGRTNNLKFLDTILIKAKKELRMISLIIPENDPNQNLIDSTIQNLNTAIENNKKTSELLDDAQKAITKRINQHLTYAVSISGTTVAKDLVKEGGKRFIPDFGLVSIFPMFTRHNRNDATKVGVIARPMVGVNIKRRHMNPDVRLGHLKVKNKWLYHTSLFLGFTVGKIDTDNGRYTDTYNSVTVLTGMNIWTAQGIRAGLGGAWLRQTDQNPINTDSRILLSPYLNLSFDLRFLQSIGRVGGSFF